MTVIFCSCPIKEDLRMGSPRRDVKMEDATIELLLTSVPGSALDMAVECFCPFAKIWIAQEAQ